MTTRDPIVYTLIYNNKTKYNVKLNFKVSFTYILNLKNRNRFQLY